MCFKVRKNSYSNLSKHVFPKLQIVRCYTYLSFITLIIIMKSQSKGLFAWGRLNLVDSATDVLLKCVFNPK